MSVKICEDPATEFKNLISLMKDPTDTKKEDEGDGDLDSDDEDPLIWDILQKSIHKTSMNLYYKLY